MKEEKHLEKRVDLRKLIFHGTFLPQTEERVLDLGRSFYQMIETHFGDDFLIRWKFNDRYLDDISEIGYGLSALRSAFSFSAEGYDRRRWENHAGTNPVYDYGNPDREADDYLELRDCLFEEKNVQEASKEDWMRLFNREGMIPYGIRRQQDLFVYFNVEPYWSPKKETVEWYGSFLVWQSAENLKGKLDSEAEDWLQQGKRWAVRYCGLNCQIMLEHDFDSYSLYFGRYPRKEQEKTDFGQPWQEQYRYAYQTEIAWAQILSRQTGRLGLNLMNEEDSARVRIEKLPEKVYLVRSNKSVTQTDISELKAIKRCLYSVILPRSHSLGFGWKPRRFWEKIPVLEEELTVLPRGLHLEHFGKVDVKYVANVFEGE